jgi:anthranilate synthase/indole-3-glycerol phosphate synthase/phosphoribosylanthranilate isomerase
MGKSLETHGRCRLIGVNNRDLRTFKLDLNTTVRIADAIRQRGLTLGRDGISLLALSGIRSHADVVKFETCGARGILIGEHLMKSGDVDHAIKELLLLSHRRQLEQSDSMLVQPLAKICGITSIEYALAALRSGANLIGIIMVEGTPRYVAPEEAKAIVAAVRKYGERTGPVLPDVLKARLADSNGGDWFQKNAHALREACARAPLVVGVFSNKSAEEMNALAQDIGLDLVQLHGNEGFDICREVVAPTIRVFHLPDFVSSDGVDPEAILQNVQTGM